MVNKKQKTSILFFFLVVTSIFVLSIVRSIVYPLSQLDYDLEEEPAIDVIKDINALDPRARKLAEIFLEECQKQGLEVEVTETLRSKERQEFLFEQGRSRPGPIVTWTKNSKHIQGLAFDICKKGPDPYGDDDFFSKCAQIGLQVGLSPGYYWKNHQDKPHFEYNP